MNMAVILKLLSALGLQAGPLMQKAFDEMLYPALLADANAIANPLEKKLALDVLPALKQAVDDAIAALVPVA